MNWIVSGIMVVVTIIIIKSILKIHIYTPKCIHDCSLASPLALSITPLSLSFSVITLSPTLWWHFGTKMLKTKQKKAFEKSICVLLCTDTLQHSQLGRFGVGDCECNCCSLLNSWPILLLIALKWISFTKLCCTHFQKRWESGVRNLVFFTDRWRIFWPLRWCWICGKPLFVVFITALDIVSAVLRESHPSIVRWG